MLAKSILMNSQYRSLTGNGWNNELRIRTEGETQPFKGRGRGLGKEQPQHS